MVDCAPFFDYGATEGTWSYGTEGYESMSVAAKDGGLRLDIAGSIRLGVLEVRCYGRTTLAAGESAYVTLSWGASHVPGNWEEATAAREATIGYWRDWLSAAKIPDHPWRPYLERSAQTLKGFSCADRRHQRQPPRQPAASETPGGARNWDYRTPDPGFAFMLRSLYRPLIRLGKRSKLLRLHHRRGHRRRPEQEAELQIMYGIGGEHELTERTIDHLYGWRAPARSGCGNGAWNQRQHDVWGMLLGRSRRPVP